PHAATILAPPPLDRLAAVLAAAATQ
ncbi:MAG: hypothetical protein JWN32_1368, partial [Solirubrobacterales bacterium]|nr:hypothetical protein [Solirubrobacterales bacterium]